MPDYLRAGAKGRRVVLAEEVLLVLTLWVQISIWFAFGQIRISTKVKAQLLGLCYRQRFGRGDFCGYVFNHAECVMRQFGINLMECDQ